MSVGFDDLVVAVDRIVADVGIRGVVRVDIDGFAAVERAYGLANRAHAVPNTVHTRFAMASGSKLFTALAVMSLVEQGTIRLDTPVRSVLGDDLPLIDGRVTVEHLLAHRSGIGDYLDESAVTDWTDYLMPVPVQHLADTEQFVAVLDGHPMKFEPGQRFDYSNGGYVVLALVAERVAGVAFHDLVANRVCGPANMIDTAYLRSDELGADVALGYVHDEGLQTNVFHLPVRGNGDGGAYTNASDMCSFWYALFSGLIVRPDTVDDMTQVRGEIRDGSLQYGLGCWLDPFSGAVSVHGFDPGVGFVSTRGRRGRYTCTVLGNQSRGAWPTSQRLVALVEEFVGSR
jgi:CubicO group peptidase (beta-lactamase class C family)